MTLPRPPGGTLRGGRRHGASRKHSGWRRGVHGLVLGLGPVLSEVRQSLEVFLNHRHFRDHMGGQPRRGLLFEGPPGTGKTHTAKAMAKEAGVPFLFLPDLKVNLPPGSKCSGTLTARISGPMAAR